MLSVEPGVGEREGMPPSDGGGRKSRLTAEMRTLQISRWRPQGEKEFLGREHRCGITSQKVREDEGIGAGRKEGFLGGAGRAGACGGNPGCHASSR